MPPSKIIIEINFIGIQFDVATRTREYVGYNQICELLSNKALGWHETYDSGASLAFAKKTDEKSYFWKYVIVFENKRAILNRIRSAVKRHLSGIMASIINADDIFGKCQNDNEKFNDFQSPHVLITLGISTNDSNVNLVKYINIVMVLALHEIAQELKVSNEYLILA